MSLDQTPDLESDFWTHHGPRTDRADPNPRGPGENASHSERAKRYVVSPFKEVVSGRWPFGRLEGLATFVYGHEVGHEFASHGQSRLILVGPLLERSFLYLG